MKNGKAEFTELSELEIIYSRYYSLSRRAQAPKHGETCFSQVSWTRG